MLYSLRISFKLRSSQLGGFLRAAVSSESQEDKRFSATIKHIGHTTVTLGISNDVVGIGYLPRGKLN